MDAQHWRQVRALFDELVELYPDQQAERLAGIGASDPALRDSVAALLAADGEADERLGEVEAAFLPELAPSPSPERPQDPLGLAGHTVSHFRVQDFLGGGGMGVVYRAEDLRLGRTVALKFLPPALAADGAARARLLTEARAASALDHPNIAVVHEIAETQAGRPFIAMAWYQGETLKARLARGPLPVSEALEVATQLASALGAAHRAGIIHRDLKPANVLFTAGGVPKLVDFGIAKLTGAVLTREGSTLGTVAYMSPEQTRGQAVDARTDLWSLGVALHEMLTGERPFRAEDEQALIFAIRHDEPPPPSTLRAEVPPALDEVVGRLLRKEPQARYASADEVLEDLERRQAAAPAAEPRRRSRRAFLRQPMLLVLLALLLAGGAAAALVGMRGRSEAPATAVPAPARTAVAVLPFVNLSAEGEHAYVAAALQSELLTQLSQVAALTVISRTSVIAYQGTSTPLKQIASELGVGSVLEGSVQVLNGRLRVNVQLIDAATDAYLWANRYDRELDDAFAIQSDIAQQIVAAVGARLSSVEQLGLAEAPTANTEAYQLYLQALNYLDSAGGEPRQRHQIAQQLLERALALDPEFALAYVELSVIHGRLYFARYDPDPVRAGRQREAAETALRLAPQLPQAHFAMGLVHYWGRRDYRQALEWFARALERLPNDNRLWAFTGLVHRRLGNWEEASAAFEQVTRLDPRGRIDADGVGNTYVLRRLYAEGVRAYNRSLDLHPDAHTVAVWKGWAYLTWQGQLDTIRAVVSSLPEDRDLGGTGTRAAVHLRLLLLERQADSLLHLLRTTRASTFEAQNSLVPAALYAAWAHRLRGDSRAALAVFDSARVLLDSLVQQRPDDPRVHAARGFALAGLGRREEALREADWLQRSEIYRNDAFEGSILAEQRARILAQAGEAEAALDEIEGLLARPSMLSVHVVRLDPLYDPIRGHPRFQALLAGAGGGLGRPVP